MGVVVAGLAIPFAGVVGIGATRRRQRMDNLPDRARGRAAGAEDPHPRRRRQPDRHALRREPRQRPARPGLADHGQGDRRDRGLPLLRARRARPEGHAARARHQPGHRRRRPGRLVDHPADGQADPAQPGATPRRSARRRTDDTYARKIRELRYAIAFEQNYSKDWILERYLNIAYFGDGAYGIQAAARHYFAKNANKLNLRAVGAAGRPGEEPRPASTRPTPPTRALERRNVVLDRMAAAQRDHRAARPRRPRQRTLGLDVTPTRNGCVVSTGAVLLRLRRQLPHAGPVARQDRRGPQAACCTPAA